MKGLMLLGVSEIDLWIHISSDAGHNPLNESVLSCCSLGLSIYRMKANGGSGACLFLGIFLVIVLGIFLGICWY